MAGIMVHNSGNSLAKKPCDVCGTWLIHWKKRATPIWMIVVPELSPMCANQDCFEIAFNGSIVCKTEDAAQTEYIVPLCEKCLALPSDRSFIVECKLVPARNCWKSPL